MRFTTPKALSASVGAVLLFSSGANTAPVPAALSATTLSTMRVKPEALKNVASAKTVLSSFAPSPIMGKGVTAAEKREEITKDFCVVKGLEETREVPCDQYSETLAFELMRAIEKGGWCEVVELGLVEGKETVRVVCYEHLGEVPYESWLRENVIASDATEHEAEGRLKDDTKLMIEQRRQKLQQEEEQYEEMMGRKNKHVDS